MPFACIWMTLHLFAICYLFDSIISYFQLNLRNFSQQYSLSLPNFGQDVVNPQTLLNLPTA